MWKVTGIVLILGLGMSCSDDDDASSPADPVSGDVAPSEDAEGAPTADEGDGCALLSVDEVASAAGADVTGAMVLPTGCQWPVAADDPGAWYEWQAIPVEGFEANREVGAGFQVEDVSGLGDRAFRRDGVTTEGDVTTSEIWVQVGDEVFFVRSTLVASDEVKDAQVAIADLIVDRLGG